ncbi:AfsR/SARP family transcriptional regulator [Nonomuraea indica]|uniref:AfsR/SARP family transcriptional regulator n=1 Tax=Nonomuraea indica TaxID=1581193 RepID=UPI000C7DA559|nr:BTAD domain-containing putative transcriptional regulator [Nonomuraea indica]
MPHGLRFALLGPLRAWRHGRELDLGRPQQRSLLAMLVLRRGRAVSDGAAIEALWGEAPPVRATQSVRILVSRLRAVLEPGGPPWQVLTTVPGGYVLGCGPGTTDLDEFDALLAEAAAAQAGGDLTAAHARLTAALALWQGDPLAGLPGPAAEAERAALDLRRFDALERRLDLDLVLSRHREVIAELTTLCDRYPLRERLREMLMLALYRSGRQAEALGIFDDTRRRLADELGVDPDDALTTLYKRILDRDPSLSAPAPAEGPAPGPAPAQLPADVADFVGRDDLIGELAGLLRAGAAAVPVTVICGMGGMGKTTLAVHLAHRVRESYPDGQLYVNLRGSSPDPLSPEAVLGAFLRALGVPGPRIPEDLEECAALYRSSLAGRRVLVVLDNAADAAQLRPLLPGTASCGVIVTARSRLPGFGTGRVVDLDALTAGEGVELVARMAGAERVAAEPAAAEAVVEACARVPLAVRIAGARLAARPAWTISFLASRLADERRRIPELRAGDLALESTFALGYRQLDAGPARAFRLLASSDADDFGTGAAAALLGTDEYTAEDLCETLVDVSLLESVAPGRYRLHDLLRLYGRGLPEAERAQALSRLVGFYLDTAVAARLTEEPGDATVRSLARTQAPAFADMDEVRRWITAEARNIFHTLRQCDTDPSAGPLVFAASYLVRSELHYLRFPEVLEVAEAIARAASRTGEVRGEALARSALAHMLGLARRLAEARRECEAALALSERCGHRLVTADCTHLLGALCLVERRFEEAAAHLTEALAMQRTLADDLGVTNSLGLLARCLFALGSGEEALATAEDAVERARAAGSEGLGARLYDLATILRGLGRSDEALAAFTDALDFFAAAGDPLTGGRILVSIAELHLDADRHQAAAASAEQALAGGSGDAWGRARAWTILGQVLIASGEHDRGRACLTEALDVFTTLGAPEAADVRALLDR